jgi:Rrf2 family protein
MKISTKGRYAIRLMIDIAVNSGGSNVTIKDISKRQNISVKYLEQIVSILCRSGFLKSSRGAHGGYKLTKRPEEYTVGDILRVTEGGLAPVSCLEDEENRCERAQRCTSLKLWSGLYKVINEYVDGITIADLAKEEVKSSGMYDYCI